MSDQHQISQEYRGRHPAYICASKLCHIHSATHWTQEVRQMASDCHEVYCLFSPQCDMQVAGECAVRRHRSSTCVSCEGPFIAACSFNCCVVFVERKKSTSTKLIEYVTTHLLIHKHNHCTQLQIPLLQVLKFVLHQIYYNNWSKSLSVPVS